MSESETITFTYRNGRTRSRDVAPLDLVCLMNEAANYVVSRADHRLREERRRRPSRLTWFWLGMMAGYAWVKTWGGAP